ncbi:hypothetical protein [Dyella caseinilytica]|uniref:Flagellar motor switch protein FliN-like C-terminal domain-containing protein n=1 Tax=Dyella caseinilytica TaxID=1849581 RepID=A0ABX7GNY5_9GAMM|nr:hypothetical protein [Dyella caseinilytica]QRN52056.1 hypothetical protein ISN74_11110 [Dyella caseinilytica]GGA15802.1 hypothetical protein GCM10011408_42210 [Dyella caseinilytica]
MVKDVRFGWLGETRREALHALLAAQVNDWAREWWIGSADGAIEVQPLESIAGHDKRSLPLLSSHEAGSLAVHLGAKDFDAIGRFLAGTSSDADSELAYRIGEDALKDLAARIQRRAGIGKASGVARGTASLSLERASLGAFGVSVSIGRLQMELAIDRQMADRLAPPAVAGSANLVSRQSAIQHAPLRVVAMMDFGSVDLAHLSDLSVGEILVGDRKLDEALQIHLEGHGAVASGYLRRLGEQRAVVVDGLKPQENSSHE